MISLKRPPKMQIKWAAPTSTAIIRYKLIYDILEKL